MNNYVPDAQWALFWLIMTALILIFSGILFYFFKKYSHFPVKEEKKKGHCKYIFKHPSGKVEKIEIHIISTEEGIYETSLAAQYYLKRHPYHKVAVVSSNLNDYNNIEWKSAKEYFETYGSLNPDPCLEEENKTIHLGKIALTMDGKKLARVVSKESNKTNNLSNPDYCTLNIICLDRYCINCDNVFVCKYDCRS